MAIVPTVTTQSERLNPLSGARIQPVDTGAQGAAISEGLQRIGQAGQGYAESQDELDAALDNAGAKTLDNQFVGAVQGIRSNFLSQQGLNAGVARASTEQSVRDLQSSIADQATTPRMKRMIQTVMGNRVTSLMGEIANHVTTQTNAAENDASQARQSLAADEAITTTDPVHREQSMLTGINEINTRGARMGESADAIAAERLKFTSGVHSSILQGMVTNDNLDGAVAYAGQHLGEMTAPDQLRYAAMVKDPLQRREQVNDAGMVMGMAPVAGSKPTDGPVVSPQGMFSTIRGIESGGRQFGPDGKPLTSSAGAVGVAQVMPSTGPEAAKLAGEAWDPDRFSNDPAYNAKLGNAYFNKQLQTFGDPAKAAAAYNCGPGRCQQAIDRATAAGEPGNWRKYLPGETQAYVQKFSAGVQSGIQQAPERQDLNGLLARADTVGQAQGWSPERIDRAKQEITRRVGVDDNLISRQESDAKDAALDAIADMGGKKGGTGFTDMSQLPAAVRANLSSADRVSFMAMAAENAKTAASNAVPKANGQDAFNLNMMAKYDPEGFKAIDLGMYQNKVAPSELQSLSRTQADMRTAGPTSVSHGKIWSAIERGAPQLGIDLSKPKPGATPNSSQNDGHQAAMRIFSMMHDDLMSVTNNGQRQPTDDEVQHSYDRSVRDVYLNGNRNVAYRAYQLSGPGQNVPDTDRQQITAAFQRRYGRQPNEGEIANIYARKPRR